MRNIADYFLFDRIREGRGDRIALHCEGRSWRYQDVAAEACRFAAALRGLGVRREERVVLAAPDSPELVAAVFGTLALGAVVVLVNPALEVVHLTAIVASAGARVAVVGREVCGRFREMQHDLDLPEQLVVLDDGEAGADSWLRLREHLPAAIEVVQTHCDDPAVWLFSGGTTGTPKAVVQSHASFANTTERYAVETLGWHQDDVTIAVPKLSFGYALGSNVFFTFRVGAAAVLFPQHPTPERLFELVARHRVSILINVPTMVRHLLAHPEAGAGHLESLRFATSAGEALPPALWQQWCDTFAVPLLDGLGTAEMWHIFVTNRPADTRPGTLGRVVAGFDLEARDENGVAVPAGEVGRMWVRGGSRAIGYWQDAERSAAAFRGEWFVGGDLISIDGEGYTTYHGRDDDVLKVGGRWVAPAEVEACLLEHPWVRECVVVGVANEDGLIKPIAFVDPEGEHGDLEAALRAHVVARLAPYKQPRRVLVCSPLPRTHLGKVDRGALRRRASST